MTNRNDALRRGRRWRYAGALGALTALAFTLLPAQSGVADNGLPAPGWSATATSPTTHVTDGQRVVINVKSNADVSVNTLEIRECRFGVTYAVPADINPDAGNCPNRPVSTSADYFVTRGASDGLTSLAKLPSGASVPYLVGEGVVDWSSSSNHELVCDPTHPCALVLKLSIGTTAGSSVVFETLKITFTDSNPLASCGGFAKGALATAGSDAVSDAWAQWTRAECARTGKGAPTGASFPGEGPALTSFANGDLDLVYTGAGYDEAVGLATNAHRGSVAVPLALNASVIAAGGGQHQLVNNLPIGDKIPYPDGSLAMSAAEVGALLGGGQSWISRQDKPYGSSILTRNAALQGVLYAPDNGVYAPSESLASSWFMTKYLSTLASGDFVRPNVVPPAPHGADSSLALATTPFDQINLYTGRPSLAKVTVPAEITSTDGPIWTMTDLASARALDLTPVALQSGNGFVGPTPATMNAAVAAMTPDAAGVLIPDPTLATTTVSGGAVQPYPLTYVLYAIVPTEQLFDTNACKPRTDSQALLTSWLSYVTGAGQQDLPPGMEPLPPALLAQAKAKLASVGSAKSSVKCTPPSDPGGGNGNGGGNGGGNGNGNGSGNGNGNGNGGGNGGGQAPPKNGNGSGPVVLPPIGGLAGGPLVSGLVPTPTPVVPLPGKIGAPPVMRAAEVSVKIPGFRGHHVVGAFGGVIAIIGIALLMALAAWYTSRSRLKPLRAGSVALLWIGVGAVAFALVVSQLGPALQQREQRALLARYRAMVSTSANELQGLPGVAKPKKPEPGAPVGIVEIGALKIQDVVVEGAGSAQTRKGPGHVPGTAGLGQPGNSVVVARHRGFGRTFSRIGRLHKGDDIVVTTTQGQSLYKVVDAREVTIGGTSHGSVRLASASSRPEETTLDELYGPSRTDQLTLVTSSSRAPWDTSRATEVVAKLVSKPFVPTPQGKRSSAQTGTQGDARAWPSALLAVLAFGVVIAGSVLLYRKLRFRTAYVLTAAPLVAITVLAGETLVRLLPAWA